jgi:hypothetical protein
MGFYYVRISVVKIKPALWQVLLHFASWIGVIGANSFFKIL